LYKKNDRGDRGLTFGRDDRLEAGGEETIELKIVNLRGEIAHPDGEVSLTRQQTVRVVIQLESTHN